MTLFKNLRLQGFFRKEQKYYSILIKEEISG